MVLSPSTARRPRPERTAGPSDRVAWHEVECGGYRADLPLWRELAEEAGGRQRSARVLEIGAGTGRVALDLARRGHRVTALDLDPDLLDGLRAHAAGVELETVCQDARTLALRDRDFALCIVPMQTVQLLAGSNERVAFLRRARAHLRPGGLVACAIVGPLEPFVCDAHDARPAPDVACRDGERYVSRVVRVRTTRAGVVIERERVIGSAKGARRARASERDAVELARLSPRQLEREGIEAGLSPAPTRSVPGTREHVGSAVVMLRA